MWNNKGIIYMLLASFTFAIMNVCIKFVKHLPVSEVMVFRAGVQLLLSLPIIFQQRLDVFGNNTKLLVARGVTGTLALFCYVYTLQNMPLASAMTLYYLAPIMTAILAKYIYQEQFASVQWLFFALSFAGIIMVKGFDIRISFFDFFVGISGAAISGLSYNFVRQLGKTERPILTVLYFPLVTFPIAFLICLMGYWQVPTWIDLFWLISTGITTQIGQVFLTLSYQHEEANKVVIFSYVGILYASAFGYFLFHETYPFWAVVGMCMVLAGVLMSAMTKRKIRFSRKIF
ncbi:MAG: DMT family transporter [Bacteroidia bacterium]|nr:DMT family transporter [Bacteroidia bacterium]MDW8301948.1 DMT family transporter [Bacteroidia bacterium]